MAGLETKGEAVGACDVLPLWNWCKYLYNYPIVRFCFEAAVVYLRFKVARPPWRAVASLTRLRQISRVITPAHAARHAKTGSPIAL